MVLSDRERDELRTAVIEYLTNCGVPEAVVLQVTSSKHPSVEGSLEKRWSTIRRLSAKNVELEAQSRSLQSELQTLRSSGGRGGDSTAMSVADGRSRRALVPAEFPLATLKGHRDTLTSVCLHPAEALCFSSSEDGTVRVWDTVDFVQLQVLRPHTDTVNEVAIEPQLGAVFATCSNDKTIKIFGAPSSGKAGNGSSPQYECQRTLLGHSEPVSCITWLRDNNEPGSRLLSGDRGGEIRVWDTVKCVPMFSLGGSGSVWIRALAVPSNTSLTATASSSSNHAATDSQQCRFFASCGGDEMVRVWDVTQRKEVFSHHLHSNVVHAVAFSHFEADCVIVESHGTDNMKAAVAEEKKRRQAGVASVITLPSGEQVFTSPSGQNDASDNDSGYTPKFLASAGRDKVIHVVALGLSSSNNNNEAASSSTSTSALLTFQFHQNWVRALHFTRSGRYLISIADDGLLLVHDLTNRRLHRRIVAHDHFVTCFSFSGGCENLLATGSADTTVKLWRCS